MEEKKWYMQLSYEEAKEIIATNILQIKRNFVAVGYYLGYVQDNEMYLEEGYKGIGEFAYDKYGISAGSASRWIRISRKFSKGGNSPILDDKYKEFSKSQLQEMLYLEDERLDEVTPDMTVKDIREIRQAASRDVAENVFEEIVEEIPKETQEVQATKSCVTGFSEYPEHCPCCGYDGVECCAECEENCNGRCGWPEVAVTSKDNECEIIDSVVEMEESVSETAEIVDETPESVIREPESVIGFTETVIKDVEESLHEELTELSEYEIAKEQLRNANMLLNDLLECYTGNDKRVRKQKVMVGALALFVTELEEMEESVLPQPALPSLKNNEQRKEWLHDYKSWGLWYEDKNTECFYYKYDFDNGARLIVETYLEPETKYMPEHDSYYYHLIGGPEPPQGEYGITKWVRHDKFTKHPNSETELVEFLKYIQKVKK